MSYLASKLTCIFQFSFSGSKTKGVIFQMTYFFPHGIFSLTEQEKGEQLWG